MQQTILVCPERRNDQAGKPDRFGGRDTRGGNSDACVDSTHDALLNATPDCYPSKLARCVSPTDRKSCVRPFYLKPCSVQPLTTGTVKPEQSGPIQQSELLPERGGMLSTADAYGAAREWCEWLDAFTGKKGNFCSEFTSQQGLTTKGQ